jgi:hypothetical protein
MREERSPSRIREVGATPTPDTVNTTLGSSTGAPLRRVSAGDEITAWDEKQ